MLAAAARRIDEFSRALGSVICWIALAMVLTQFTVVLLRYVFGVGSIVLQESIVYMHGLLFMLAAGYTLLHNGHVRVDIFYRVASARRRALVDLVGVFAFLLPVCGLIWYVSWPYVAASWAILEGSRETSGIPAVFLFKSAILAFCLLVSVQGLSLAARAVLVLAGADVPDKRAS